MKRTIIETINEELDKQAAEALGNVLVLTKVSGMGPNRILINRIVDF